jgi:hypothetical protein
MGLYTTCLEGGPANCLAYTPDSRTLVLAGHDRCGPTAGEAWWENLVNHALSKVFRDLACTAGSRTVAARQARVNRGPNGSRCVVKFGSHAGQSAGTCRGAGPGTAGRPWPPCKGSNRPLGAVDVGAMAVVREMAARCPGVLSPSGLGRVFQLGMRGFLPWDDSMALFHLYFMG